MVFKNVKNDINFLSTIT